MQIFKVCTADGVGIKAAGRADTVQRIFDQDVGYEAVFDGPRTNADADAVVKVRGQHAIGDHHVLASTRFVTQGRRYGA